MVYSDSIDGFVVRVRVRKGITNLFFGRVDGRSFVKLREVFGVPWDAALLPRTSTGLEYSDSIGGCGVTVRVRKGDRIHFWGRV